MSTEIWRGPTPQSPSGDWNDASNWSGDAVPGPTDLVEFDPSAAPYTVTIHAGQQEVVEDVEIVVPDASRPGGVTVAVDGGLLESDFLDADGPDFKGGIVVLLNGATFYTSTEAAGVSSEPFRYGDGTASLLDLGSVGPTQEGGSPMGPESFGGAISGFGGGNLIRFPFYYLPDERLSYSGDANGGTLRITELQTDRFQNTKLVLLAQLAFAGNYGAANFNLSASIVPNDQSAQISFQPVNTISSTGDRRHVLGTTGNDLITASGALDTIDGNGGSDDIRTGAGGYSRVTQGSPGDGAAGRTTITLNGRGNAVSGGDESFMVAGGTGFTGVALGDGDNEVTLGGAYNTVAVGGGANVIDAGGGFSKVVVTGNVGNLVPTDLVTFSGEHNQLVIDANVGRNVASGKVVLTGGSGYGNYLLGGFGGSVTTGGLYNTVSFAAFGGGRDTLIRPGDGYDVVNLGGHSIFSTGGSQTIILSGTHNTIQGQTSSVVATGGDGGGLFLFNQENTAGLSLGEPIPSGSYDVSTGGSNNSFFLLDTNSNTIVAGGGGARVSITDPAPLPQPGNGDPVLEPGQPPGPPIVFVPSQVTFAGIDNSLTAAGGPVSVTGGEGYGTFVLGDGDDSVTTGGSYNKITLGHGTDTVSAAGDHASVTLNGTHATLALQGGGDLVFLNAGASGTIGGGALPDLHVRVAPGIGQEVIQGLAADPRTVVDLTGGAGGYSNTSQVVAALRPDGAGGTVLPVGGGALDFAHVAPADIHAGMFVIV